MVFYVPCCLANPNRLGRIRKTNAIFLPRVGTDQPLVSAGGPRSARRRPLLSHGAGDPTRGHDQAGPRPVLIVSEDRFNQGPADRVIVCPLTSTQRGIPAHVPLTPPEGGLRSPSVILCDAVRSMAKEHLVHRWGAVTPRTMAQVADRLRILLGLW
jgi:mRNA interferase MazF